MRAASRIRRLIHEVDPAVVDTWKWRGVPVWEHSGILCTGETDKVAVTLTFAKGAALPDPKGLFNASLEGIYATAFKALIRAAIARKRAAKPPAAAARAKASQRSA